MKLPYRLRKTLLGAIPFLALIGLWTMLVQSGMVRPIFLPGIDHVLHAFYEVLFFENYANDIYQSVYRVTVAFFIAAALAIPLGLYSGFNKTAAQVMEPFVSFARYLPVPAFVPLCILWFGLGDEGKIAIIFLGTFFQLLLMVADIARTTPKEYYEAALTLGASRWDLFGKILAPASLPEVVNASRVAIGWAWTYLVVAEIAGATSGIGFRIMEAQRYIHTSEIFAGIIVIGILGIATDLIFQAAHRISFRYLES